MSVYGMKDASDITIFKKGTHEALMHIDYANASNTEWSSDRVYATMKGANAIGFDGARTGKFTIETELFDKKLLAMVAGSELKQGTSSILARETFALASDGIVKLASPAIDGSLSVFKLKEDELEHDIEIVPQATGINGSVPAMVDGATFQAQASDDHVVLKWNATAGATKYEVFRDGKSIGTTSALTLTDEGVAPATQYNYTVIARNEVGDSSESAVIVITTNNEGTTELAEAVKPLQDAIALAKKNDESRDDDASFTVDASGALTIKGNAIQKGDKVVVYYMKKVAGAQEFTVDIDKFADSVEIYATAHIREKETGKDEFVQMYFPNAKVEGSFTFNQNAKDPTSLTVTFDLFPDKKKHLATYKFIED